jgi:hypothetical protein
MTTGEHIIAGVWAGGIVAGLVFAFFILPHNHSQAQWQRICQMDSFHPDITAKEREVCQALRKRKH